MSMIRLDSSEVPSLSFFQAIYWLYMPMSLESIEMPSRKVNPWYVAHSPTVSIHQLGLSNLWNRSEKITKTSNCCSMVSFNFPVNQIEKPKSRLCRGAPAITGIFQGFSGWWILRIRRSNQLKKGSNSHYLRRVSYMLDGCVGCLNHQQHGSL